MDFKDYLDKVSKLYPDLDLSRVTMATEEEEDDDDWQAVEEPEVANLPEVADWAENHPEGNVAEGQEQW